MTTDGMWRPNHIFPTLNQQFARLRLKGKWYAFQCRRRGDAQGVEHWSAVTALHEAEIARTCARQVRS